METLPPLSESETQTCVVCLSHQAQIMYTPCKHQVVCFVCDTGLHKNKKATDNRPCPICRSPINGRIRVLSNGGGSAKCNKEFIEETKKLLNRCSRNPLAPTTVEQIVETQETLSQFNMLSLKNSQLNKLRQKRFDHETALKYAPESRIFYHLTNIGLIKQREEELEEHLRELVTIVGSHTPSHNV